MGMKAKHQYRITLTEVNQASDEKSMTLDFQDQEDIFEILTKIDAKKALSSDDSVRLGVALRLLGPTLMQNRKNPLFIDFFPHFKEFMLKLKKTPAVK